MRKIDRILNIAIIFFALLWLFDKLVGPSYFLQSTVEEEAGPVVSSGVEEWDGDIAYTKLEDNPSGDIVVDSESSFSSSGDNQSSYIRGGGNNIRGLIKGFGSADFDTILANSYEKPQLMLVFTSWCPHCRKVFSQLSGGESASEGSYKVTAVSIDSDLNRLIKYIAVQKVSNRGRLPFPVYHAGNAKGKRELISNLSKKGLHFSGSIPYMAIFVNGEAIADAYGASPSYTVGEWVQSVLEEKADSK